MAKTNNMTEKEYIQNVLMHDGFAIYVQESEKSGSGKGVADLKFVNSWSANTLNKPVDNNEYRRLREKSPAISRGIEFHKDFLIGSGIDVKIEDPEDTNQIKYKQSLQSLVKSIKQDRYTQSLTLLIDIMVDEALTVGCSAAEIVYKKDLEFLDYATENVTFDNKGVAKYTYETKEPDWKSSGLEGIERLKIIDNAIERMNLYRLKDWESSFWTLDEYVASGPQSFADMALGKSKEVKKEKKPLNDVTKLHPWQVFWLSLNRRYWHEKGKSIIEPVVDMAKILEKIEQAMGEGAYRAGNKKYFIVTGSEKRQWGDNTIINVMKKIDELGKDPNKVAIPVPSGMEIKEMGGQVFDGAEITDHFLTMIADGMNVPKEVLTGVKGGQTERPWQASMVSAKRRQLFLELAIETQLFTPHIWCQFGKEKTKQSGRSSEEVSIPKVKWLHDEGGVNRISVQEHLEILFKILNVANPISATLKLAVEQDFARTLSYDEVRFPSQEEVKKNDDKLKKIRMELQEIALEKAKKPPEPPQIPIQNGDKNEQPKTGNPLGKSQGQPEAPNQDKLEKRGENGVSKAIKETGSDSQKGVSKPMGGSRMVNESEAEIELPQLRLNINVTQNPESKESKELLDLKKKNLEVNLELLDQQKNVMSNIESNAKNISSKIEKIKNKKQK
jgi:hypothetical protein